MTTTSSSNDIQVNTISRRRLYRRRGVALLTIASALAATTFQHEAHADHPLVVAGIGAGAVITAAAITATGAVVAAAVIATGAVVAANINSGNRSESESMGGGSVSTANGGESLQIGAEALQPRLRSFLDRKLTMVTSDVELPGGGRAITADVDLLVDGDVERSDPDMAVFNVRDEITFRFDVSNVERSSDAKLSLRVRQLLLSTEDILETQGHAQLRFTARQDGREIWSFVSRVEQGITPTLSGPPELQSAAVRVAPGRIAIENVALPVPYEAPGTNASTRVEVTLTYEGQGART